MASENAGGNKRRYLQAERPSVGSRVRERPNNPSTYVGVSRDLKRKYNNEGCGESDKRPKNDNGDTIEVKPEFASSGNFANQRLQNLRRSLAEGQNITEHSSSINLGNRSEFSRTQQRRSIQDRLKIKRDLNAEVSTHFLNKSLPNFKNTPKDVINSNKINNHMASSSTVTTPSCDISESKVLSNKSCFITSKNIEEKKPNDSVIENDVEMMDWVFIDQEIVVENVNQVRKELSVIHYPLNVPVEDEGSKFKNNFPANEVVHIVVDTNIFISHLDFISKLKDMTLKDGKSIRIVIPWMVQQELDYMKSDHGVNALLGQSSTKAIKFINNCLSNKDPTVRGQTVMEASSHSVQSSNNPDDGILFCCIQFWAQCKNVVLLSNDVNLRNKALFSNIPAYPQDKILADLVNKSTSCSNDQETEKCFKKIKNLTSIMSNCLNEIIKSEMKHAYGDNLWLKMAKKSPPYNLYDGLGLVTKFWIPVFSIKLLKQCKHCIDEFRQFLKENRIGSSASKFSNEIHSKFVEMCLRLCIYLKNGCPEQRLLLYNTIEAIQKNASVSN